MANKIIFNGKEQTQQFPWKGKTVAKFIYGGRECILAAPLGPGSGLGAGATCDPSGGGNCYTGRWESYPERDEFYRAISSVRNGEFHDASHILSISMPNVYSVGESAFKSCKELEEVVMPKVITIGHDAFNGVESEYTHTTSENFMTKIQMPNLKTVGDRAFMANNLTDIDLPLVETIGEDAFTKQIDHQIGTVHITKSSSQLKTLTLGKITQFDPFKYLKTARHNTYTEAQHLNLTTLKLPLATDIISPMYAPNLVINQPVDIPNWRNDDNLTRGMIIKELTCDWSSINPSKWAQPGEYARGVGIQKLTFVNRSTVDGTEIKNPDPRHFIDVIREVVFQNCISVTAIPSGGVKQWYPNVHRLEPHTTYEIRGDIHFPTLTQFQSGSVAKAVPYAVGNSYITYIYPKLYLDSMTQLRDDMFSHEHGQRFELISIPKVTLLPDDMFKGIEIHELDAPKLTYIGSYALDNYRATTVNFPEVTQVADHAFWGSGSSSIVTVSLPKAQSIGTGAFYSSLRTVDLPECISISVSPFNASSVTLLNIPKAIMIGDAAFSGIRNASTTHITMKSSFNTTAEKDRIFGRNGWTSITFTWVP